MAVIYFFRMSPAPKKRKVDFFSFNILYYAPYFTLLRSLWRRYLQSLYNRRLFYKTNTNQKKEKQISDLLVMACPEARRVAVGLSLASSSSELMNKKWYHLSHLLPQSQWHHCHTHHCHFHPFHCCKHLACCSFVSMSWHFLVFRLTSSARTRLLQARMS